MSGTEGSQVVGIQSRNLGCGDDNDNVPIYSTPLGELTEDKKEAVAYLGLRSYLTDWEEYQCEEGATEPAVRLSVSLSVRARNQGGGY